MIKGALVVGSSQIRMPGALMVGAPYDLVTLAQLIKDLFKSNEVGFAYDPNDISTMCQDAAGTIPVTGAGQPVGLIKDKSGRNNHAYQTVSASRPILQRNATTGAYYLVFDGVDDFLVTNNINFTSTDKVSVFAGVRNLASGGRGILAELSAGSGAGLWNLNAPAGTDNYSFISVGTVVSVNNFPYQAIASSVLTARADIVLDYNSLRINGVGKVLNADMGSGNFGNYPLYIGRRGGTTFPFNGHIYNLIGVGRLTTDAETIALEKSIAKNTGVTLSV